MPFWLHCNQLAVSTLCPRENHWGFMLCYHSPSFSIWASPPLSLRMALLRTPRLPPCSTSAQLHSLFLSSCSLLLRLFHPLSPVQWPLSKCVFVSSSEAQCVSARWPQATHDQWSTAKTIRQETPLLAVPPLLSSHHLWLCWFSFSILAYDYWIFQTKSSIRTGVAFSLS